jgi:hypothetical protein
MEYYENEGHTAILVYVYPPPNNRMANFIKDDMKNAKIIRDILFVLIHNEPVVLFWSGKLANILDTQEHVIDFQASNYLSCFIHSLQKHHAIR